MEYFKNQYCPVCEQRNSKLIYSNLIHTCHVLAKAGIPLSNEQVPTDVLECNNCGHRYLSKILSDERLDYYYNIVETEYYDWQKDNPSDHRPADTKKFAKYIDANTDGNKIMEIGCGLGYLLSQLKILGNDCYGVEPSSFASSFAREKLSLNVLTGLLDDNTYPDFKFNAIVLSDVVEHVPGINSLFTLVEKYLAPGGKVFVFTGDSKSNYAKICGVKWLYLYSWEHLSFFNKNSIGYLFKKHGLQLKRFDKVAHTGSYKQNAKIFIKTFGFIILNKLNIRKYPFYSMAFDHFIAIGTKTNK
jgi:2-polyprenyl-3-methyl-5-hydroxy-6-metoxy-1,4-benzoquinol methylase